MTIKNVQRIPLGTGATGYTFESGMLAAEPSSETHTTNVGSFTATDLSNWKELERKTLLALRRDSNKKLGLAQSLEGIL